MVQTGNTSGDGTGSGAGTYDHNLLVNRGMPDQHTIDSITGLRTALNAKYEKPFSGIPKTDLGFSVATLHDIDVFRKTYLADVVKDLDAITQEVILARGTEQTLKEYIDTKVPYSEYVGGVGGGGGQSDTQIGYPLYEEHRATENQRIFSLGKTYRMGTHQLEVYLDGLRMIENDDYIEKDDHTVEFLFDVEEESFLLFMVRAVVNSGLHEEFIATKDQTIFTLTSQYALHQNLLQVFRNGNLLRKGIDYRELNDVTIEFMYPLQEKDFITFHQAGASDPVSSTLLETEIGRMKVNHGYTTLLLQESTNATLTDYVDMYLDSFITHDNIDVQKSYDYKYQDQSITVKDIVHTVTSVDDFGAGVESDVDTTTYPGQLVLRNLPGASENNDVQPYLKVVGGNNNEGITLITHQHHKVFIYSVEKEDGTCELHIRCNDVDNMVGMTDGSFFNLSADQDDEGNVHLVYDVQGSLSQVAKVEYLKFNTEYMAVEDKKLISDETQDAVMPDIVVMDNTAHIVFASKRVKQDVFNIDYRSIKDSLSGFTNVTVDNVDALNPRITKGSDKKVRIVFDSAALDGTTKNIRFIILNDGVVEYGKWLTNSTTFDNIQADIEMDAYDNARVVWMSKRLSTTYGIDYTSVSLANIATPVAAVANGTYTCGRPRIAIDYEDVAHVVFHANTVREDHTNICYAYIYVDDTISAFEDVASLLGTQFKEPFVYTYGDELVIDFLGDTAIYEVTKSLANYTGLGIYDYAFDSQSNESKWLDITIDSLVPDGTNISCEYRLSDDNVAWTSWTDLTELEPTKPVARYLQLRVTLTSVDVLKTPSVDAIHIQYHPSFIEVQSVPKTIDKETDSAIVIAKYQGDVSFQISRDGGEHFVDAEVEKAVSLIAQPVGSDYVIKARIQDDSVLQAWGLLW